MDVPTRTPDIIKVVDHSNLVGRLSVFQSKRGFVVKKQKWTSMAPALMPIIFSIFLLANYFLLSGETRLEKDYILLTAIACTIVGVSIAPCFNMIKSNEERIAQLEQQLAGKTVQAEGE
jgi:GTP-sensing pleiotropic transcriptional regulator CodY